MAEGAGAHRGDLRDSRTADLGGHLLAPQHRPGEENAARSGGLQGHHVLGQAGLEGRRHGGGQLPPGLVGGKEENRRPVVLHQGAQGGGIHIGPVDPVRLAVGHHDAVNTGAGRSGDQLIRRLPYDHGAQTAPQPLGQRSARGH